MSLSDLTTNDIALLWDADISAADFNVEGSDFETDGSMETAVLLSLFTDRRAEDSDTLPTTETDRRGWWGDVNPVVAGDQFGSRLWLLARSKQTQDVVDRAREYVAEALAWLTEDKVAERVDVESEIVGQGMLGIGVTIYRPKVDTVTYRFNYTWATQEARRS